ncbi:hypothetical protein EVAR_44558_1 [Eumeta japonica]|uniref:DUF4817 domain-containing protein n=1 Tax=Eumeta variegata TaxID=151549 RepID=A0A4C1XAD4_EUMVA|nr:hypothetical protein EVAR_44558_1 [Eumeta japonica]
MDARLRYRNSDIADNHFVYGFYNGNARAGAREYHRRYPAEEHRIDVCSRIYIVATSRRLTKNTLRPCEGKGASYKKWYDRIGTRLLTLAQSTSRIEADVQG